MLTNEQLAEIAKSLRSVAFDCTEAADRAECAAERIDRIIAANVENAKDALEILGLGPKMPLTGTGR